MVCTADRIMNLRDHILGNNMETLTARLACLHMSTTWSLCSGFMVKVLLHTRFFSLFFLIAQRVCNCPLFALRVE